MKLRSMLTGSLLVLALFTAACGGQTAGSVDGLDDLIAALRAAGAEVQTGDQVTQEFFSAQGRLLSINGVDVQVFEYASAGEAQAEAALVAADGGSIGTRMVAWIDAPHFFQAGRLLVLYVGSDQSVLALLEGALGAQFAGR